MRESKEAELRNYEDTINYRINNALLLLPTVAISQDIEALHKAEDILGEAIHEISKAKSGIIMMRLGIKLEEAKDI